MVHPQFFYETVSAAIKTLREHGFVADFNLAENVLISEPDKFLPDEFDVVEVYRYEGDTDPADEATVYGIVSKTGKKGILVTGYGVSADKVSVEILEKLSIH